MAFTVMAVGDVMVTRRLAWAMAKPGVQEMQALLASADHVVGNLEIPLCEGGVRQEKMVAHKASSAIAVDLKAIGFDTLVLANNHAMDYGVEGLLETMQHLRAAGIAPAGAGTSLEEALQVHLLTNGDIRVALVCVSALLPLGAAATSDRPGIAPLRVDTAYAVDANILMEQPGSPPEVRTEIREEDFDRLARVVAVARKEADFVLAYVHWGVGGQQEQAPYQQVLGRRLVETGVDVVVGCHPHLLQEIEHYRGGWILYNLGEFFSQYPKEGLSSIVAALLAKCRPEGYVLKLSFTRGQPVGVELVPVAIDAEGDPVPDEIGQVMTRLIGLCEMDYDLVGGVLRLITADRR